MSGAFLLFGPTENSWAVGNNAWRAWYEKPLTFQYLDHRTDSSKAKNYPEPMLLISKTTPSQDLPFGGSQLHEMGFTTLAYRAPMVKKEAREEDPETSWMNAGSTPVLRSPDPNLEADTAIAVNAAG
jgi:hypothetical protein